MKWLLIVTILSIQIGCGNNSDVTETEQEPAANVQQTSVLELNVPLNSISQVPSRNSRAKANASLTVNLQTRLLSAQVNLGDHEVTAAHIHRGFAGEVGSVLAAFEFSTEDRILTISEFQLTESQLTQLLAGGYYLNLHNKEFPEGFVRGQIVPGEMSTRIFELSDAQLVPYKVSGSDGAGYITLNHQKSTVRVNAFLNTENSAIAAHIFQGRFGENGSPIMTLKQNIENPNHWFTDEQIVTSSTFDAISRGMSYINVHTDAFPDGEVRGQIVSEQQQVLTFSLNSLQSTDPRVSEQSGVGSLVLDAATGNINVFLSTQGIADATHASIYSQQTQNQQTQNQQKQSQQKQSQLKKNHSKTVTNQATASAKQKEDIATRKSVLKLNQSTDDPQQFSLSSTLNRQQVQEVLRQEWFATVSSATFPKGAVSGRVLMEPSPTGMLLDPLSLVGESNTYSINLNGEPLGSAIIELLLDNGMLSVTEITDAPAFGIVETLSVQIDAYTLAPLGYSGSGKSGERSIDINYRWESPIVSGSTDLQSEPFIRVLPGHSVEQLGLFYSLHALPLAEGLSYPITVFNALDNTLLKRDLKVQGLKEITVAAGTFKVFEVLLGGAEVNQIFYISTETPRKLIKIGFDVYPITYELEP